MWWWWGLFKPSSVQISFMSIVRPQGDGGAGAGGIHRTPVGSRSRSQEIVGAAAAAAVGVRASPTSTYATAATTCFQGPSATWAVGTAGGEGGIRAEVSTACYQEEDDSWGTMTIALPLPLQHSQRRCSVTWHQKQEREAATNQSPRGNDGNAAQMHGTAAAAAAAVHDGGEEHDVHSPSQAKWGTSPAANMPDRPRTST